MPWRRLVTVTQRRQFKTSVTYQDESSHDVVCIHSQFDEISRYATCCHQFRSKWRVPSHTQIDTPLWRTRVTLTTAAPLRLAFPFPPIELRSIRPRLIWAAFTTSPPKVVVLFWPAGRVLAFCNRVGLLPKNSVKVIDEEVGQAETSQYTEEGDGVYKTWEMI